MASKTTFVATYQGERFTRTTRTMAYTHVVVARHPETGELFALKWSQSEKNAHVACGYGWDAHRVAVVPCAPEVKAAKQPRKKAAQKAPAAPVVPAAPAHDVELCASNSRVKAMHYRVKGQQVSLCGKVKASRKPNTWQLADDSVCLACVAARQG